MIKSIIKRLSISCIFISSFSALEVMAQFPADKEPETTGYRVTFLVFSGRPNPTMVISDKAQIQKLNETYLESLSTVGQKAQESAEMHPILGYNGVLIETLVPVDKTIARAGTVQTESPITQEIRVNRGRILAPATPPAAATDTQARSSDSNVDMQMDIVSYDDERQLEKLLIEFANEQGLLEPAVIHLIEDAVY